MFSAAMAFVCFIFSFCMLQKYLYIHLPALIYFCAEIFFYCLYACITMYSYQMYSFVWEFHKFVVLNNKQTNWRNKPLVLITAIFLNYYYLKFRFTSIIIDIKIVNSILFTLEWTRQIIISKFKGDKLRSIFHFFMMPK